MNLEMCSPLTYKINENIFLGGKQPLIFRWNDLMDFIQPQVHAGTYIKLQKLLFFWKSFDVMIIFY